MWKVVELFGRFFIEKRILENMAFMHMEDGKTYSTPYHIEAQQIADELNEVER